MPKPTQITLPFSVGPSPTLKIRGIIAARDIKKDETLEKCPIVLISKKEEEEALKQTVVWKYYFEWDNKHQLSGV